MTRLETLDALESAVGKRPATAMLKSISQLDGHCLDVLSLSTFGVLGVLSEARRLSSHTIGGPAGVFHTLEPGRLQLPGLPHAGYGRPAGLVAFVAGWGETLRVNGRLDADTLIVEEAFLHCAKCVLRSRLWSPLVEHEATIELSGTTQSSVLRSGLADPVVPGLLTRAPFATIATADGAGRADISPKGDPSGLVRLLGDGEIGIPDRPGNMRRDTFHNILERPEVSVLALMPGEETVVEVTGTAVVDDDPDLRAIFEVRGNTPVAVMRVRVESALAQRSSAIGAARLWDPKQHVPQGSLPRASRIWTDHVNATIASAKEAPIPALHEPDLAAGLQADYVQNLY